MTQAGSSLRIAEILASLSLAEDLANGNPPETGLRAALIAARLLEACGESTDIVQETALVTLLRFLGCTSYSVEEAEFSDDDRKFKRVFGPSDPGDRFDLLRRGSTLGADTRPSTRLRYAARTAMHLSGMYTEMVHSLCDTAEVLGAGLGLGPSTRLSLQQMFERVDGRGKPRGLVGESIELSARVASLAYFYQLHRESGGRQRACEVIQKRGAGQLDERLVRELILLAPELEALLSQTSVWDDALAYLQGSEIARADRCAIAFADFADLKSRFTVGHSHRAAGLARATAGVASMPTGLRDELETAALLMNIGMTSVSSGVIDKPGPLSRPERDRMELHPYYTDRILVGARAWSSASTLAAQHHERPDGSGYHRRQTELTLAASILSASDAFVAMTSERAYRPAFSPAAAGDALLEEAREGRRDGNAVRMVLEASGLKPRRDRTSRDQFGLTGRELEVLRLIAVGHSNKRTAAVLGISARTVQHHSIRIYEKLGVNSRAAATLLASQNGLLD